MCIGSRAAVEKSYIVKPSG